MGEQPRGAGGARGAGIGTGDQREQGRRHLLAQFDAPLVEGVDAEDRRLDEDAMLVERDDAAERRRIEAAIGKRHRGAVAGKAAMRRQGGIVAPAHQRLGLGEAIGHQ
jgi:hypothetical protein